MTLKHKIFDSSSDEETKENYTLPKYLDFLLKNILDIKYINDSEDLKLRLGLVLHKLADGFYKDSAIRDIYKKIKSEILAVDNDYYEENFNIIKTAFNKHLRKLFKDDNKQNISDKDYQKLLHFVFNPNRSIPKIFTLNKNITADYAKKVLLQELQNSNINLKSISNNPLNYTIHDSKGLLAFAEMIDRNNKNQLKHRILEETNSALSTICKISNTREETFTINHIVHYKTGNIQTDIPDLGKYDEILSKFEQEQKYKHAIIKRIFEVIHAKESTQNIEELPRKLNYFAEKLTHLLFIVEIHRNNATLFTATMFLELIDKD